MIYVHSGSISPKKRGFKDSRNSGCRRLHAVGEHLRGPALIYSNNDQ